MYGRWQQVGVCPGNGLGFGNGFFVGHCWRSFSVFFFLWIVLVGQLLMGYTDWKKMISDEGAGMLGKDRGLFGG